MTERTDDAAAIDLDDYDVAIAHEHYRNRGGGEHVAEHLADALDAPIYAGFVRDDATTSLDVELNEVFTGWKTRLMDSSTLVRDLVYHVGWQRVPKLADYDVVVQSGNGPGWYVPPDDQVVLRYTHSTPRNPYDRFHESGRSLLVKAYAEAVRVLYYPWVPFPDRYVANSELVAYRLEKYWDVDDPAVVYPPVPVTEYEVGAAEDREAFYLTYSRLAPNKCFDEIIEAFRELPQQRLLIGGDGPLRDDLEAQASDLDNVEFLGYLPEDEKRDLLARAKALVYAARNEDFGMVPVEAFAAGTPVVGVDDGYTRFQVSDGDNGVLFHRGTASLVEAVERFEAHGVEQSPSDIAADAERYSVDAFETKIEQHVREVIADVPTV